MPLVKAKAESGCLFQSHRKAEITCRKTLTGLCVWLSRTRRSHTVALASPTQPQEPQPERESAPARMGQLRSAKQVRTAASFQSRLWFDELLETTRLCLTALCS